MWEVLVLVAKQGTLQEIFGRGLQDFLRPPSSTAYKSQINQSQTLQLYPPNLIYTLITEDC